MLLFGSIRGYEMEWWWWGWGCCSSKSLFWSKREREREKGTLWYEWWLAFCVCVAAVAAKNDDQQLYLFEGWSFGFGWVVCVICGVLLFFHDIVIVSLTHAHTELCVSCRGHSHVRFFLLGRARHMKIFLISDLFD